MQERPPSRCRGGKPAARKEGGEKKGLWGTGVMPAGLIRGVLGVGEGLGGPRLGRERMEGWRERRVGGCRGGRVREGADGHGEGLHRRGVPRTAEPGGPSPMAGCPGAGPRWRSLVWGHVQGSVQGRAARQPDPDGDFGGDRGPEPLRSCPSPGAIPGQVGRALSNPIQLKISRLVAGGLD